MGVCDFNEKKKNFRNSPDKHGDRLRKSGNFAMFHIFGLFSRYFDLFIEMCHCHRISVYRNIFFTTKITYIILPDTGLCAISVYILPDPRADRQN